MKLTAAQTKILETAKKEIDLARALDYPDWLKATNHFYAGTTEYQKKCFREAVEKGEYKNYWEAERAGIVLAHCNSRSLKKLAEAGLVEIIYDSTGEYFGIDTIKIINY